MTRPHDITKDVLAKLGIEWPDKHPDTGEPFTDVKGFARTCSIQKVHHLPIGYPERRVATAWETQTIYDGDYVDEIDVLTAWRDLTDDEWAAALAHYEKHKHETMGFVPGGPPMIEGEFETASGSRAKGQWDGEKWFWTETSSSCGVRS